VVVTDVVKVYSSAVVWLLLRRPLLVRGSIALLLCLSHCCAYRPAVGAHGRRGGVAAAAAAAAATVGACNSRRKCRRKQTQISGGRGPVLWRIAAGNAATVLRLPADQGPLASSESRRNPPLLHCCPARCIR
jgi:hypothetical protein